MKKNSICKKFAFIFALVLLFYIPFSIANTHKQAPEPIVITPENLQWGTFDAFPPGVKAAIIIGDPRKNGYFMFRVKVPANYMIPPNWQTSTVYITVLSGRYHIGIGDKFNPKNGKTLPSTGSVIVPAGAHLYFWSTNGALLEVHGIGPWNIHYVNPSDDPRN